LPKHFRDRDVDLIVDLIRNWSGTKLTWDRICDETEKLFGTRPTRQALFAHSKIKNAYLGRKKRLRLSEGGNAPVPSSLAYAGLRIARLKAENDELRETNARFQEQFVKWQYNAYKYGVSKEKLNEELPRIDRERTDGRTSTELANG
jgi:hypothetical protein